MSLEEIANDESNMEDIYLFIAYEGKVKPDRHTKALEQEMVILQFSKFIPPGTYQRISSFCSSKLDDHLVTYTAELNVEKISFLKSLKDNSNVYKHFQKNNSILNISDSKIKYWSDRDWFNFYIFIKNSNLNIVTGNRFKIGFIYFNEEMIDFKTKDNYFPKYFTLELSAKMMDVISKQKEYTDFFKRLSPTIIRAKDTPAIPSIHKDPTRYDSIDNQENDYSTEIKTGNNKVVITNTMTKKIVPISISQDNKIKEDNIIVRTESISNDSTLSPDIYKNRRINILLLILLIFAHFISISILIFYIILLRSRIYKLSLQSQVNLDILRAISQNKRHNIDSKQFPLYFNKLYYLITQKLNQQTSEILENHKNFVDQFIFKINNP